MDLAGRIVGENLSDTDRTRATVERFVAGLEHVSADDAGPAAGGVTDGTASRGAHSLGADPTGTR